ncbi:MAG TPA: GYD domain-containing protein, partial [Thermoleophilaceae bacterium]|nr:GYD domain-containing protein [Thermoleophilaceae bacterium]
MPKYLIQASYSSEGMEGVRTKGGSSRREAVVKTAESLGGQLEAFYFAFGEHDAVVLLDLPDNQAA